jgi:putative peptidoglycan lipid II flippase
MGYGCAIPLPPILGIDPRWGAAGLAASAGIAGWVEFALLRRSLSRRIGAIHVPTVHLAQLWGSAAPGVAAAWLLRPVTRGMIPQLAAAIVLGTYGIVWFGTLLLVGNANARMLLKRGLGIVRRVSKLS